ncbi:rRNA large subunit pseudouridine synthase E [Zhongshania sp. CAU 1632]|uniref:rRNA large subunit pseudouridine synthase E n=1 Tax=Zhongshania aquimaris TaxID=2857107 RepID=A0ABS6VT52_9GAMM|nr:rRNA large subunit pseudouridine synthase E [Zhongshania aquimaris]
MCDIFLFNKPYQVMSQFTDSDGRANLSDYIRIPAIYPAGRLDYDSEGLMILTGDGELQHQISHPRHKLPKTYWVQVDGDINEEALKQLRAGVGLNDGPTLPAIADKIVEPASLWPRTPPVRFRANIPTSWISLTISEGRNRQVRRMTAAVGFPTLRLIRASIGNWNIEGLAPGEHTSATLGAEFIRYKPQNTRKPKPNYRKSTKPSGRKRSP